MSSSSLKTWIAWVAANALGELLGLGFVFLCGFGIFHLVGEPRSTAAILALAAAAIALGAAEGAIVGHAQWLVLRTLSVQLIKARWVFATVIGAAIAWLLGMIPSTLGSLQESPMQPPPKEPSQIIVLLLAAAMGIGGGLILSFAQWRVLRRQGPGALWWLPANAFAWAIGMPWIFWLVGVTVGEHNTPTAYVLFVAGLGVAGALVGAVHGAVLVRVLAPKWRVA